MHFFLLQNLIPRVAAKLDVAPISDIIGINREDTLILNTATLYLICSSVDTYLLNIIHVHLDLSKISTTSV